MKMREVIATDSIPAEFVRAWAESEGISIKMLDEDEAGNFEGISFYNKDDQAKFWAWLSERGDVYLA